jgi:hypothetical protein
VTAPIAAMRMSKAGSTLRGCPVLREGRPPLFF